MMKLSDASGLNLNTRYHATQVGTLCKRVVKSFFDLSDPDHVKRPFALSALFMAAEDVFDAQSDMLKGEARREPERSEDLIDLLARHKAAARIASVMARAGQSSVQAVETTSRLDSDFEDCARRALASVERARLALTEELEAERQRRAERAMRKAEAAALRAAEELEALRQARRSQG